MSWIIENGLALYGAVTGTAALMISFFNYRHKVKKDQIKLSISFMEHPQKTENIERLNNKDIEHPWEQPHVVEVYLVTVRNLGSVSAPLHDVGVVDKDGYKHQASITLHYSQMSLLKHLPEIDTEALEPRGSKTFSVYLHRDEPQFAAVSAYAIDQTGKEWK